MKELDGLGDPVLDEHSLGIASHQGGSSDFKVVGEEDGGFLVPQFDDAQLAQWALIALQVDTLVQDFRGAKGSSQGMQGNPAPGGSRSAPDLSQHFFRATAQGDKKDALLVEAVEIGVGGQLRVKDQFGRGLAGALAPKVHEAQNFTGSIGPSITRALGRQTLSPSPTMPSSVSISIKAWVTPFRIPVETNSGSRWGTDNSVVFTSVIFMRSLSLLGPAVQRACLEWLLHPPSGSQDQ